MFSAKVADYTASRPDYPATLFETLRVAGNLCADATVADIGSGTGLLTRGFLQRRFSVVAVEPNALMRRAADQLLNQFQGYRSVDGCAESMPLGASSIDLITAAQAFHWFEIDRAKAECMRVLRQDGQVALIWNDRVQIDPLHVALNELFARYGGARRAALVAHEERRNVLKFFGATVPTEFSCPHEHLLNENGLLSLVFSRSFIPDRDSPSGCEIGHLVSKIFHDFATDGLLEVRYTTVAIIGRPQ
ncbi:class I SAM-dependent methyltransferase [Candidatus Methylospira mobilis]|uniref:Class I SAM-dependent methyltransferase n=1 Tax=Candidatus Methylospira mobilis TaxID=1808979 RepID=A0A5Q0BKI3_9GAMM|nr:class I SAM-dependent methyltransferase [Candidatus Methylospira mobilis]